MIPNPAFHRTELLLGTFGLTALQSARILIVGLGGVGSWCAEVLIRSGASHLTIVDSDLICVTNINRQVQALHTTVGKPKVHELKARLLAINPRASIEAICGVYDKKTSAQFDLSQFDYVIDAIDSLSSKVELIMQATLSGARLFSALGAANRLDATQIRTGSLWKVRGCPLGKFVRKRLRKYKFTREVTVVYSAEECQPPPLLASTCGTAQCMCPRASHTDANGSITPAHEWCSQKKQINGSMAHITSTFGNVLAGLVIMDVVRGEKTD